MPRMKIFNALEEETFETPPVFNSIERKKLFTLPVGLTTTLESLRTPTNKVCFIVTAGYFRSRRKFFGAQFRQPDVEFVCARMGLLLSDINLANYDRVTAMRHQQMVMEFFGYRKFDTQAHELASREIAQMVRSQLRPRLILLEVIQLLVRWKCVVPSYNTLANLIVQATNRHKHDLIQTVDQHLTVNQRQMLEALLEKDSGSQDVEPLKVQRYRLTLLKKSYQSTKPSKIKNNLADFELLCGLYLELEPVITALGLTHEGLRYYANSVIKAEIFQVTRRVAEDRYLHLLAFIAHQTFRLQDTLMETLLQSVQTALNTT